MPSNKFVKEFGFTEEFCRQCECFVLHAREGPCGCACHIQIPGPPDLRSRVDDLEGQIAGMTDLGNTYCREHNLPEGPPKQSIEQLAWKLARVQSSLDSERFLHKLDHSLADQWQARNEILLAILRDALKDVPAWRDRAILATEK
jgi:hypothetical protein